MKIFKCYVCKYDKIVKNQDGGLKVPLFDLKRSNVIF